MGGHYSQCSCFLGGVGYWLWSHMTLKWTYMQLDRIFTVSVGGCRQAREEAGVNCEIQNYSLGPQCSTHRDSWKNTEVDIGKEKGHMCATLCLLYVCHCLVGDQPSARTSQANNMPKSNIRKPSTFLLSIYLSVDIEANIYTVLHSGLQQSWRFRQSPSYSFHFLRMQPEVEWSIFRFHFALFLRMCFPAYLYGTVCMQVPMVTRSRHQIPWIWRIIWLWATKWMLGTELESSAETTSALNHCQLEKASWLWMGAHVHILLSVLGPCLPWACAGPVHALIASERSCVHLS